MHSVLEFVRLRRTIYWEKNQRTGGEVMQAIKGKRPWPSWLLRVPPDQRKADEGWPVGERNRCSVCRSWHYVQHDAMGSLHVGQKSWETEDSSTGSALSGRKFYLCNAGNARSYTISEGLVTRDPPPIPCSLCYPAKTERHNIRGLPYPWGHCSSWVPCSPNGVRWGYFWRCRSV